MYIYNSNSVIIYIPILIFLDTKGALPLLWIPSSVECKHGDEPHKFGYTPHNYG